QERVLQGEFAPGARVPSVRELAVAMGVNPNTVNRSFQLLVDRGVIEARRGLGYFVRADARERILAVLRARLLHEELPRLQRMLHLLGWTSADLARALSDLRDAR